MNESINAPFSSVNNKSAINLLFKTLLLLNLLIITKVSGDHGQWDCQANEVFIECGACEATCKMPLIKNCSKGCRPQRCECQSKNGFVRAHDGACIHVSECETYTIMSQLHPGQHVAIIDHNRIHSTTKKPSKKHKKTTKPHGVHFDEPQTEVPPTTNDQENEEEENEREIEDENSKNQSRKNGNSKSIESVEDKNSLPPSIAPNNYGRGAANKKPKIENKKPFSTRPPPTNPTSNAPIVDRESALAYYNQNVKAHFLGSTDSSPGAHSPSFRSSPFIASDKNDDEGGYGLQGPTQTYGARPISPGEVSDKYVARMPSVGAPAKNPMPPANPPYKFAYAPSSPVLMHDDSAYALYPPQKYRIYRRKRKITEPVGPPKV